MGDVAAFIIEPIQGKGVNYPTDDYFQRAQALCRRHGTLLVCDEVQTGLGRTGKWFAFQHWDLEPDIITLAKSLSGGYVPCGAIVARRSIYQKVFSRLDRLRGAFQHIRAQQPRHGVRVGVVERDRG